MTAHTINDLTDALYRLYASGADQMQIELFIGSLTSEQAALVAIDARNRRLELEKQVENATRPYNTIVESMSARFLSEMNKSGETTRSGSGWRATVSTQHNASMPDAGAFYAWLSTSGRYDMLQRRLSSKVVQDFVEETKTIPPGLTLNSERKITFYRK